MGAPRPARTARGSSGSAAACATSRRRRCARAELPLDSVQGFVLTRDALDALVDELAARPPEERERVPGIKRGRGEVILAAAVVLRAVLEASGADGIEVTEAGPARGDLPDRAAGAGRPAAGRRACG